MNDLNLQATTVFKKNYQATKRFVVNQGGTGSSKTYSLAQLFIIKPLEETGKVFSVVRNSMPSLKASAMRDYFNILQELGLYDEKLHNKTDNTYMLNGNLIEFFSLDEPQKVRSRRRDYLWINEANELSKEAFTQLDFRTNIRMYLDFNPSDEFHWIYDDVISSPECELIVSTYQDNPFLPDESRKRIEALRDVDHNYWKIYGLGERGASSTKVYTHWRLCEGLPEGERIYGLDFGYNNPTALIEVILRDNEIYAKETIYESRLTNNDLINKMLALHISKEDYMFPDHAEPQRIEELMRAGFNVIPADKDVKKGIDAIKSRRFNVVNDSTNLLKELKSYSWKTKDGKNLDEPIKLNDHALDALRYAVHTYYVMPKRGIYKPPSIEQLSKLGVTNPYGGVDW